MDFDKKTSKMTGLAKHIIVGMIWIVVIALVAKQLSEILIGAGLSLVIGIIGGVATGAVYFFGAKLKSVLK